MKIPIFPGKYHQNGGFSMAMLVSGRVPQWPKLVTGIQQAKDKATTVASVQRSFCRDKLFHFDGKSQQIQLFAEGA